MAAISMNRTSDTPRGSRTVRTSRTSASSSTALNSSCTTQAPCQISMSAPVACGECHVVPTDVGKPGEVAALLGEVAVNSIVLAPRFTVDQGTVNRALLVASVPAALWLAAAIVVCLPAVADALRQGDPARGVPALDQVAAPFLAHHLRGSGSRPQQAARCPAPVFVSKPSPT